MPKPSNVVMIQGDELGTTQRAIRALLFSHGGTCRCQACLVARPLLARIEAKLVRPAEMGERK